MSSADSPPGNTARIQPFSRAIVVLGTLLYVVLALPAPLIVGDVMADLLAQREAAAISAATYMALLISVVAFPLVGLACVVISWMLYNRAYFVVALCVALLPFIHATLFALSFVLLIPVL